MKLKVKASDQKISLDMTEAAFNKAPSQQLLSEALKINPLTTFYVRVEGGIKPDFNIKKGDLLIVDRSLEPSNNSITLSVTEGEWKLAKVSKFQHKLYLVPENPGLKPIEILETMDFQVWGVVTHVISPL